MEENIISIEILKSGRKYNAQLRVCLETNFGPCLFALRSHTLDVPFQTRKFGARSLGQSQVPPVSNFKKSPQITSLRTPPDWTDYSKWQQLTLWQISCIQNSCKLKNWQILLSSRKCRTTTRSPRTRPSTRWPRPPCTRPPTPWRVPGEGGWRRLWRRVDTSPRSFTR